MNRHIPIACLLLTLCGTPVYAQGTLGEILDKGAVRLSQEEVTSLMAGATASGETASGNRFEAHFNEDGSLSGTMQRLRETYGYGGTWKVDDDGRTCQETRSYTKVAGTSSFCQYFFRLGSEYFVSESPSAKDASIRQRHFRR